MAKFDERVEESSEGVVWRGFGGWGGSVVGGDTSTAAGVTSDNDCGLAWVGM